MSKYLSTPFNIDLLILDKNISKILKPVTKTTIFESSSSNFEPEGLFSSEIFGQVGSPYRSETFGYVDLKVKVLHPLLYSHIVSMKSLYKSIMAGEKYGIYNKSTGEIELSNIEDGRTGYTFFIETLPKLKFEDTGSVQREFKVKLLKMYNDPDSMIDKWLVLPAGLRDYVVNKAGVPSEDEVNDIYRKLITVTGLINNISITPTTEHTFDNIKYKIQNIINELYEYFKTMLDGKNKFIQGKWAKRAIINGTRNVLTPTISNITQLGGDNQIGPDDTVIGLYQFIRGISPITMNKVNVKFISSVMDSSTSVAKLVNPKTMKTEHVSISIKKRDAWTSMEGLDETIGKLESEIVRRSPVMVDKYYLMLVHDRNNKITVIKDTNEITDDMEEKYIRPITYYELMYISIYDIKGKYPAYITRYPVINLGGIYPSKLYVKTTETPRTVELTMDGITTTMYEYPNLDKDFINSISVASIHIDALGADYDGDTISTNILYTDESIAEIDRVLNEKESFLSPDGKILYSVVSDTLSYVTKYLDKGVTL